MCGVLCYLLAHARESVKKPSSELITLLVITYELQILTNYWSDIWLRFQLIFLDCISLNIVCFGLKELTIQLSGRLIIT